MLIYVELILIYVWYSDLCRFDTNFCVTLICVDLILIYVLL